MEGSLDFYLVDVGFDWDSCAREEQEVFAWWMFQEWICSGCFKAKATYEEIDRETTLGRFYLGLQEFDQYWKDLEYRVIADLRRKVYGYWIEKGWVCVQETRKGRRRVAEYSSTVLKTADRILGYGEGAFRLEDSEEDSLYRNVYWARSVRGELCVQKWERVVVMKEVVFRKVYDLVDVEAVSGKTKEEIAELLKLPKPVVNDLCRWMQKTEGWCEIRRELKGVTRREMFLYRI